MIILSALLLVLIAVLANDKRYSVTPGMLKDMRGELLRLCKLCKEELSYVTEASITVPISSNKKGTKTSSDDIKVTVTREEFESAIKSITSLITASIVHTVQQWISQRSKSGADSGTSISVDDCLDEIVLVGGASRVPAVRSAIRAACEQLHIVKFCSGGATPPHELCTSLNPDEIVAEGLALRGAILSGTDTGLLKDVLMMDCMAMSIGLMSWSKAESESSTSSSNGGGRVFERILFKGDKIPAKRGKRFRLADPRQRFVSLDIYEEIDQLTLRGADSSGSAVTEFKHHLISTVDVPVPVTSSSGSSGGGKASGEREIEVVFCMDERGFLSYETYECSPGSEGATVTKEGTGSSGRASEDIPDESSQKTMFFLGLYLVMMALLYLAAKIFLVEVVENPTGSVVDSTIVSVDDSVASEF